MINISLRNAGILRRNATPVPFTADDTRRNIRRFLIVRATFDFSLWLPIWILFLHDDLGLSFTTIMVLDAIYQAQIVLFEVPTGMLADRIGRKPVILLSIVSMAISLFLFGMATSAVWIFASFFAWALSVASFNGTDSAFLYESLVAADRGQDFPRVLGRITTTGLAGSVIAMIIGGWLATLGYRIPIFVHVALFPIAIIAALLMREPPRTEDMVTRPREAIRSLRDLLRRGVRFRTLLAYSASLHVVFFMVIVYKQPLLVQNGIPSEILGWVYAASSLFAAGGPLVLTSLRLRYGTWRTLRTAALGVGITCVAIYFAPGAWLLLPVLLTEFLISGIRPVVIDGLNQLAGPRGRATVLSLRGIVDAGVAGPMEITSGWFADRVPLRQLFLACAVGVPSVVGVLNRFWRRGTAES